MPQTKKNLAILLAITFALKLCLGVYFSSLIVCRSPDRKAGAVAIIGGDTFSYLDGADNLLENGEYFFWNGERKVYAGRMPYYAAPYFVLRTVFPPATAKDIYVVIQILIDALATVVFAWLCFEISHRKSAFWLGWAFYFGCFNLFITAVNLWTESLSLSFLIFFLFYYHRFWADKNQGNVWPTGVFLALLTVLKPYFIIIYPLVTFGIFIKNWRTQEKDFSRFWRFFYQIVTLGLPLFILILPWMVRNEIVLGKFIPAQENTWAGYNYSSSRLAFANFAGAWGGGSIYWDENDAGCYFLTQFKGVCNFTIPEYALTEGYDRAEIERVRQDFIRLQENYSPDLDVRTTAEFKRLSKIYREEQPFRYYIGSKFIFLKKLFWHTNNYNLPIHSSFRCFSSYQLFFKVVQFGIYLLALTLGSFGLIKIIVQRRSSALFVFIVLITIVLFLELRTSEVRYVSLLLPIFIIGLADTVSSWKYLQNRLT